MPDEFISTREFGLWITTQEKRWDNFDKKLEQILTAVNIQNGRLTLAEASLGAVTSRLADIETEDKRIETAVQKIYEEGCHQYRDHERMLVALEGAGVLPDTDGEPPKPVGFSMAHWTARQKAAAGVGAAALLIPSVEVIIKVLKAATEWWSIHGAVFLR